MDRRSFLRCIGAPAAGLLGLRACAPTRPGVAVAGEIPWDIYNDRPLPKAGRPGQWLLWDGRRLVWASSWTASRGLPAHYDGDCALGDGPVTVVGIIDEDGSVMRIRPIIERKHDVE